MPTAAARAASRITLTRALVALGAVLVGINVASAIWDARADRDRTELRARRNLSNLSGLLSEQTAAALETVDLVLRDAVRDGTPAKVAAMTPRLRDEMIHIPQVAGFLVIDAGGRVVGRTNETPAIDHGLPGRWRWHEMALRHVAAPQRARRRVQRRHCGGDGDRELRPALPHDRRRRRGLHQPSRPRWHRHRAGSRSSRGAWTQISESRDLRSGRT